MKTYFENSAVGRANIHSYTKLCCLCSVALNWTSHNGDRTPVSVDECVVQKNMTILHQHPSIFRKHRNVSATCSGVCHMIFPVDKENCIASLIKIIVVWSDYAHSTLASVSC